MKNIYFLLATLVLSSLISHSAFATPAGGGVNASSLKLQVLGVWVSTSAQCTSPIRVCETPAADYQNILTGPSLCSGTLADGTYPCVIIKMSDVIKHIPETTATTCIAGTEYTGEVCRAPQTADSLTGTTAGDIHCTGNGTVAGVGRDEVYMYLTTDSGASTGDRAFEKPISAGDGKGLKLASPLVVVTDPAHPRRAKFVVNATGKVVAGGGECGMNPPVFSFESVLQ